MVPGDDLSQPAKLLLLVSLLAKDRLISHNGKGFLKDLILRRDPTVMEVFAGFGSNPDFLEQAHDLIDRESRRLFEELFADCSLSKGKYLSKTERKRRGLLGDKGLTYGEVDFSSFAAVLREVAVLMDPDPGEIFYDLGSGTGKAVYVARLTQDFAHCVGIELLEPLHSAAQRVTHLYNSTFRRRLDSTRPQNAAVYPGSFLDYDWSDGDVVFANSTCFPDQLMERLANQAQELRPGAVVVTFTKGLESCCFDVLERRRFDMSWGPATVFIHRRRPREDKIPPPRWCGEALRVQESVRGLSAGDNSVAGKSGDGGGDCSQESKRRDDKEQQERAEGQGQGQVVEGSIRRAGRGAGMALLPRDGGGSDRIEEGDEEEEEGEDEELYDEEGEGKGGKNEKDQQPVGGLVSVAQQLQLQVQSGLGGEDVNATPLHKSFTGFGDLLNQAEQAQAERAPESERGNIGVGGTGGEAVLHGCDRAAAPAPAPPVEDVTLATVTVETAATPAATAGANLADCSSSSIWIEETRGGILSAEGGDYDDVSGAEPDATATEEREAGKYRGRGDDAAEATPEGRVSRPEGADLDAGITVGLDTTATTTATVRNDEEGALSGEKDEGPSSARPDDETKRLAEALATLLASNGRNVFRIDTAVVTSGGRLDQPPLPPPLQPSQPLQPPLQPSQPLQPSFPPLLGGASTSPSPSVDEDHHFPPPPPLNEVDSFLHVDWGLPGAAIAVDDDASGDVPAGAAAAGAPPRLRLPSSLSNSPKGSNDGDGAGLRAHAHAHGPLQPVPASGEGGTPEGGQVGTGRTLSPEGVEHLEPREVPALS